MEFLYLWSKEYRGKKHRQILKMPTVEASDGQPDGMSCMRNSYRINHQKTDNY